jgi:outer membrane lipoprotein-sorting protein
MINRSWKLLVVLLVCAVNAVGAGDPVSSKARKADEIVNKHVEAIGGLKNIEALRTLSAKGRLEQGTLELPFTLWMKRPNKSRVDIGPMGKLAVVAYNGKTVWWVNRLLGIAEPTEMPEEYAKAVLRWTDFESPLVGYKSKGHQIEYEGEEKTDSGVLYKIKLTLSSGDVWHVYIDGTTYLEAKRTFQQTYGGRSKEVATWFRGYAVVNGVSVYRVIEGEGLDGTPYTMTFLSFEGNVPVDDARFEKQ